VGSPGHFSAFRAKPDERGQPARRLRRTTARQARRPWSRRPPRRWPGRGAAM